VHTIHAKLSNAQISACTILCSQLSVHNYTIPISSGGKEISPDYVMTNATKCLLFSLYSRAKGPWEKKYIAIARKEEGFFGRTAMFRING